MPTCQIAGRSIPVSRRNSGFLKSRNPLQRARPAPGWHLDIDLRDFGRSGLLALFLAAGQSSTIVAGELTHHPEAISNALQYATSDWPTEDGAVNNTMRRHSHFPAISLATLRAESSGCVCLLCWRAPLPALHRAITISLATAAFRNPKPQCL
jgi:hypothetical protein